MSVILANKKAKAVLLTASREQASNSDINIFQEATDFEAFE